MKHLLTLLALVALLASSHVNASAQQTPANTSCNEKSGLQWDMNSEKDLDKYRVYSSNAPIDPAADNTTLLLMEIMHVPPLDPNGTVSQTLNTTMSEGPKYFRVSALDKTGNESPLSNEVGCEYNLAPGAPSNVKIVIQLIAPATP